MNNFALVRTSPKNDLTDINKKHLLKMNKKYHSFKLKYKRKVHICELMAYNCEQNILYVNVRYFINRRTS